MKQFVDKARLPSSPTMPSLLRLSGMDPKAPYAAGVFYSLGVERFRPVASRAVI